MFNQLFQIGHLAIHLLIEFSVYFLLDKLGGKRKEYSLWKLNSINRILFDIVNEVFIQL